MEEDTEDVDLAEATVRAEEAAVDVQDVAAVEDVQDVAAAVDVRAAEATDVATDADLAADSEHSEAGRHQLYSNLRDHTEVPT